MATILRAMGITDYDPRVLPQLLEFSHRTFLAIYSIQWVRAASLCVVDRSFAYADISFYCVPSPLPLPFLRVPSFGR